MQFCKQKSTVVPDFHSLSYAFWENALNLLFPNIFRIYWLYLIQLLIQFAFAVFTQFTKQLVSNFEPWRSQKYKQLWEPDPIVPYEKVCTV